MRRSLINILILLGIVIGIATMPVQSNASGLDAMHISLLQGDVQFRSLDTGEWFPASINMPLREGDNLWVPERGRAEILLRNGSFMRFNEQSSIRIFKVDAVSIQIVLEAGQMYLNHRASQRDTILVSVSGTSIRAYEQTVFKATVNENGFAELSVINGNVYAEGKSGRTTVIAGQTLRLGSNYYADLSPIGQSDDWEQWNRERDRQFSESRYSSPYLPDELRPYSSSLDPYGKWVYAADYGYVWTPTVIVSNWAPYRLGRWTWIGSDYVWISYEPWGWVPYHYGRWSFGIGIGWFWVPPARGYAFWGPGYVGWSYTSFYVAWVPLAPYETYYGYGNYGPHSVNITNININKTHVNVYKNVHVNNAVTAVHHDTFTRGRHVDLKLNENPFIKNGTHVGRPLIAPERATMMPIVRESQRTQTVAQATRQMPTKALREAQSVSVAKTENQHRPITPANAPVTNKSLNSQSDNRTNRLAPARPIAPPVTDGTTGRKIIADPIPKQTVSIPSGKQRNTVSAPKPLELPRQTFNRPPDRVPQGTSRNIAPPLPERRVSQAPVNTGLNAPQKTTQPRTSGHIDQSNPAPSRKSVETVQPRQNTPAGSSQAVEKAPRAGNTVARGMR